MDLIELLKIEESGNVITCLADYNQVIDDLRKEKSVPEELLNAWQKAIAAKSRLDYVLCSTKKNIEMINQYYEGDEKRQKYLLKALCEYRHFYDFFKIFSEVDSRIDSVEIIKFDEPGEEIMFDIYSVKSNYQMNSFPTKEDAVKFIEEMNWKLKQ